MSILAENELDDSSNPVTDLFDECYSFYKNEYASGEEFSVGGDSDISAEVSVLVNCYDNLLKRRRNVHSDSIYSDILEDLKVEKEESGGNEVIKEKEKKESLKVIQKVAKKFSSSHRNANLILDMSLIDKGDEDPDVKPEFKVPQLENKKIISDSKFYNEGMVKYITKDGRSNFSHISQSEIIPTESNNFGSGDFDLSQDVSHITGQGSFIRVVSNNEGDNLNNSNNLGMRRHSTNSEIITEISEISAISYFRNSFLNEDPALKPNDDPHNSFFHNVSLTPKSPRELFKDNKHRLSEIRYDKLDENTASYNLPSLDNIDINVHSNNSNRKMFYLSKKSHGVDSSSNLFSNVSSTINQDNHGSTVSIPNNIMINSNLSSVSVGGGMKSPEEVNQSIDSYFRTVIENKSLCIKHNVFELRADFPHKSIRTDNMFILNFLSLFEKSNFNETNINSLKNKFMNRYEVVFLKLCLLYQEMKQGLRDSRSRKAFPLSTNSSSHNSLFFPENGAKDKLINEIRESDQYMEFYIKHSNDFYVFKPFTLLKIWESSYNETDILTYSDLNKFFKIKLYIFQDDYSKAFNEVEFLLKDSLTTKHKNCNAFIYYLGKIIAGIVKKIDQNVKIASELKSKFDRKNSSSYEKILMVLKEYVVCAQYPRRKGKHYINIAMISGYYGLDNKSIKYNQDIYLKRAKRYLDVNFDTKFSSRDDFSGLI